jgi:hypothetical protein
MRIMPLPELRVPASSCEQCIQLYLDSLSEKRARLARHSAERVCWPFASTFLTAYMVWPNDEERRYAALAAGLPSSLASDGLASDSRADSQRSVQLDPLSAVAKLARQQIMDELRQVQRKWLVAADIFQRIVDMAHDERAVLRRGPSISKAVDLCEVERWLPGHSQLRGVWSEFRDVAHLLAASAFLGFEARARGSSSGETSILNAIWIAPDIVLTLAYGLQEFGLQSKSIRKEPSILRPDTLWRVPNTYKLEEPFVVSRHLTEAQLDFLNSRRVA